MAGNLRAFLAEILGSFAWVFFVSGAVVSAASQGHAAVALGQAFTVALVFAVFGHHSIGMFNPALTAMLTAAKRIDPLRAAICVLCQLLGAALAGLALAQVFAHTPEAAAELHLGTPALHGGIGFRTATLVEAVLTFFLGAAVFRELKTHEKTFRTQALHAGAAAGAAALMAGPLTGAAMNPARAFGTAVASGYWNAHYVYWAGPLAGALTAAAVCGIFKTEENE